MNNSMYTVLRVSDGANAFPFLYEDGKVYVPDFNPTAFGMVQRYRISFSRWIGGMQTEPVGYELVDSMVRACVPFRHEDHTYCQYYELPESPSGSLYIEFIVLDRSGAPDPGYTSAQGSTGVHGDLTVTITDPRESDVSGLVLSASVADIESYLRSCYGGDTIYTSYEIALVSDDDLYWRSDSPYQLGPVAFRLDWPFRYNYEFIRGLRFVAICKNTIVREGQDGEEYEMHVDIRSNPLPLTEDLYAFLLAAGTGKQAIDLGDPKNIFNDMKVDQPRLMNKTVRQVMEMTSTTDSKANIIQPVFFRAREMASIIVHPEVTENISINLDPYKSQSTRFYIKVEGVVFAEIGRVEGGVIFKVKGNMLPAKRSTGTYYILNDSMDLVTSGKYTYEY